MQFTPTIYKRLKARIKRRYSSLFEKSVRALKKHPELQTAKWMKLHHLDFNNNEKIAVIFGNEVTGVEQETILQCDGCIEIPQLGMKHSLNIATAAGVVLWEIIRRKL